MNDVLLYVLRWIHIASAVTLLGGMIFALAAALPAVRSLPDAQTIGDSIAARFRPLLIAAILLLLGSGLYNYLTKHNMPPVYHMLFGMKFLLALHVFAVGFFSLRAGNTRRPRQIAGIVISGLLILALSAGMRALSLNALVPPVLVASPNPPK